MAVLSAADRKAMPAKDFAGPGRSFPVGDATHARMAISGATRSERAGNISSSEEDAIKAKARAKLGDKGGEDHKAAVAKMRPEHVHKLVQDAHSGKYGPQAQQVAQSAMQPQQGPTPPQQGDGYADDTGGSGPSSMFSSGGASPAAAAPPQPASRASMFQGR
jgi:hypothetical protein